MAKSKKNNTLMHPINTVVHWYEEAQTIPAQLRKSFVGDQEKAAQLIKKLKAELKHEKVSHRKAKSAHGVAARKLKGKVTKAGQALAKKAEAHYHSAQEKMEKTLKELNEAKAQLSHAKLKQKYFSALEKAFNSVTKLFTKKHKKTATKKRRKTTKKVSKVVSKKAKRPVKQRRSKKTVHHSA